MWTEDDGVLAFEWILLATLLTIGIVGGIAAVRDATIDELGDIALAYSNLDQSYSVNDPPVISVHGSISGGGANSAFVDGFDLIECAKTPLANQQGSQDANATGP
jgi:Flp pilus assembly pilin Flp